ncbi:hypothetical protein MAHJHV65_18090 [Mycobacterium avium subsp. hominissuis]
MPVPATVGGTRPDRPAPDPGGFPGLSGASRHFPGLSRTFPDKLNNTPCEVRAALPILNPVER